jgi:nitrate reductase assembly molybdenum cofactor insertion protein NarJ
MTKAIAEVQRLLTEAVEWRLLGLIFEYPTDAWRSQVTELLADLHQEDLRQLAESALAASTEGMHLALFGPAGSVPVREVTYQGGVQFGYLMAELSAYYDAFGYCPSAGEAEDHLAVELGFMAYLKMKRALALAKDEIENASVAAAAADAFLRDHLRAMAEPVAAKLEAFAPDYMVLAGRQVLQLSGPAPRSNYPLGVPFSEDDDSAEMRCGAAEDSETLVEIQSPSRN